MRGIPGFKERGGVEKPTAVFFRKADNDQDSGSIAGPLDCK